MFPVAGCWSQDSNTAPSRCRTVEACPGAVTETESTINPTLDGIDTRQCADGLGYTGFMCTQCLDQWYSMDQICRTCGLESEERTSLIAILFVAAAYVFGISVAVCVLDDRMLGDFVSGVVVVQQFVQLGRQGANGLANDEVSQALNCLNMINFEIEYIKPGCAVGDITYATVFWVTLLLAVVALIMFIFGAWVRSKLLFSSRGSCLIQHQKIFADRIADSKLKRNAWRW